MTKLWIIGLVAGVGVVGSGGSLMAAEHGGQEHGGAATAAPAAAGGTTDAPATDAAAPVIAPITPAPEPAPAIRPIVIKFSGEVVQVNRQTAAQPVLTVRDRYGVTKEMTADVAGAKVMRGTTAASLDDLKPGDQISVDYTFDVATGKRSVQSITVADTGSSAPTPTP